MAARNRHIAAAAADPVQHSLATWEDTRRPNQAACCCCCCGSPEHRPEATPDHRTCCSAAAHSPCSGTTNWGTRRCCSCYSPAMRVRGRHRRSCSGGRSRARPDRLLFLLLLLPVAEVGSPDGSPTGFARYCCCWWWCLRCQHWHSCTSGA